MSWQLRSWDLVVETLQGWFWRILDVSVAPHLPTEMNWCFRIHILHGAWSNSYILAGPRHTMANQSLCPW